MEKLHHTSAYQKKAKISVKIVKTSLLIHTSARRTKECALGSCRQKHCLKFRGEEPTDEPLCCAHTLLESSPAELPPVPPVMGSSLNSSNTSTVDMPSISTLELCLYITFLLRICYLGLRSYMLILDCTDAIVCELLNRKVPLSRGVQISTVLNWLCCVWDVSLYIYS